MGKFLKDDERQTSVRPAMSPENREQQIIGRAYDLAEKQIMDGTASSQIITHFLKAGSTKERLELERLRTENELLQAKIKDLESKDNSESIYQAALDAMRRYSGNGRSRDEEDDEYDEY